MKKIIIGVAISTLVFAQDAEDIAKKAYEKISKYDKYKTFKQIKDIPNSFLACDDIEIGHGAKISIWLFDFLY
ncbi:MAG: hypothetical protein GXO60_06660 [Epsilonproteobacteria bacterium]|nr:hypothetical protein [Campylobacterota bacterium]